MTTQGDLFGGGADPLEALSTDPGRWPVQLAELTDLIADALVVGGGVPAHEARRQGAHVVTRVCREYGGTSLYIPKSDAIERALRDLALWAEHDGTVDGARGITALARRHRLTEQRVWQIISAERERHWRRVQPELPGLEPQK